jgi:hypothetical protein
MSKELDSRRPHSRLLLSNMHFRQLIEMPVRIDDVSDQPGADN